MKRTLILVLVAAFVLIAGGATAYAAATTIHEKQPAVGDGLMPGVDDPTALLAGKAAPAGSGPVNVPAYGETSLINQNELCFILGVDNGYYKNREPRQATFEFLQTLFPSDAIRRTADGENVYVMYDTDAGGRLYVFYSGEKNHYMFEDGFPILMKKRLVHEEFAGLAIGDGIAEVERVDPAASVYREWFGRLNDIAIENYTKKGKPPTSVHLLADGVLKIEYRGDQTLGYAITNIVYDPGFVLDGFDGETCYRIDEADYVQ